MFGEPEVVAFNDNSSLKLVVPTNVPPTLPVVGVVPAAPAEGEAFECVVTTPSVDLDPVSYSYRWYRDDVFAKDVGNVPVVPAGVSQADETWRCEARGTDGLEFSPPASVTVTVLSGE